MVNYKIYINKHTDGRPLFPYETDPGKCYLECAEILEFNYEEGILKMLFHDGTFRALYGIKSYLYYVVIDKIIS